MALLGRPRRRQTDHDREPDIWITLVRYDFEQLRVTAQPCGDAQFLAAERIERNPWTHVLRIVKAEAERTDDPTLIDAFVRLFKAWEASRYSR